MTTSRPDKPSKPSAPGLACSRPRVGLLALTLELYETLSPGRRASREAWLKTKVIAGLESRVDVLFARAVYRREEIEATVAEYEAAGVDALLVILGTYSPSQLSLQALKRTRLPILIWNTQELRAVGPAFTPLDMSDNHGVHGTQELANVLLRSGIPFHYVTSPDDDPQGIRELADFFTAAAAVRRLRSARIGLIGYPFPGMGDFAVDSTHLVASLGCAWVNLAVEEFIRRCETAADGEVSRLVAEYRQSYAVAGDVTEEDLRCTASAEIAVRGMAAGNRLDALTYQFMAFGDDERSPTVPFVAASRLMAEGIGFGGEGDLIGAAATAFFNWLQPPASFSEIFTMDFAGESLFMSHMGEANVAMARRDRKAPLVARPAPITRIRGRQLALVTSFEPGPATLVALALGPGAKWRLIASPMTIEDFGPLPGFCVPHSKLKPASGDVRQFLTAYARAGGPHHNAVILGDARRKLQLAASLLGAEYFEV